MHLEWKTCRWFLRFVLNLGKEKIGLILFPGIPCCHVNWSTVDILKWILQNIKLKPMGSIQIPQFFSVYFVFYMSFVGYTYSFFFFFLKKNFQNLLCQNPKKFFKKHTLLFFCFQQNTKNGNVFSESKICTEKIPFLVLIQICKT